MKLPAADMDSETRVWGRSAAPTSTPCPAFSCLSFPGENAGAGSAQTRIDDMRPLPAGNPDMTVYEHGHSLQIMVNDVAGRGRCAQVLQLETGTAIATGACDFRDFMINLAGSIRRRVAYRRGVPSFQSLLMAAALPGPHT